MTTVMSADGTRIDHRATGDGPVVVLVSGGLDDGAETSPIADALADRMTAVAYTRRGRGDGGGDARPYAVEREVEDLAAIIEAVGGRAHVVGLSSGGALALEATASGLPIDRVAVWEVPYQIDPDARRRWLAYVDTLTTALADDRRDDALVAFMRLAGSSPEDVAAARASSRWEPLRRLAPSLAHDAAVLGDGAPPVDRLARVDRPVLVATGAARDPRTAGLSPGFFDDAADAIADAVPDARRLVVPGRAHSPDPVTLARVVGDFLLDGSQSMD